MCIYMFSIHFSSIKDVTCNLQVAYNLQIMLKIYNPFIVTSIYPGDSDRMLC